MAEGFVFGQNLAERVILSASDGNKSENSACTEADNKNNGLEVIGNADKEGHEKSTNIASTTNETLTKQEENNDYIKSTDTNNKKITNCANSDGIATNGQPNETEQTFTAQGQQDKAVGYTTEPKQQEQVNETVTVNSATSKDTDTHKDVQSQAPSLFSTAPSTSKFTFSSSSTSTFALSGKTSFSNIPSAFSSTAFKSAQNSVTSNKSTGLKRKFEQAITGEEDEETVFEAVVRLYGWNLDTANWIEKGRGVLKLNDLKDSPSYSPEPRAAPVIDPSRSTPVDRSSNFPSFLHSDSEDSRQSSKSDDEEKSTKGEENESSKALATNEDVIENNGKTCSDIDTKSQNDAEKSESNEKTRAPEAHGDSSPEKGDEANSNTDKGEEKDEKVKVSPNRDIPTIKITCCVPTEEKEEKNHAPIRQNPPEFSRLIMRVTGTLRIILNLRINPDHIKIMPTDDEKSNVFRFSDGQQLWAISGSLADIIRLRKLMDARLSSKKKVKS